jgi:hypothetical protein
LKLKVLQVFTILSRKGFPPFKDIQRCEARVFIQILSEEVEADKQKFMHAE